MPILDLRHVEAISAQSESCLVHLADERVDRATVTSLTALDVVEELPLGEATSGVGELEGPEESVGRLEVGANGGDLVNEVLNRDDTVLAERLLNDGVVGDGDPLAVDLGVTALVDELTDGLEVGGTVGNVGLDELEHLRGSLVELDEDTVVDLEQTEELQDLAGLGRNVVDTAETDNKGNLGLRGDVEVTAGTGSTAETDLLALGGTVLLGVLLSPLEDHAALGLLSL